ncbi:MAG: CHAT domain-containing protein [Thermoanaerobaculia bacterium]|nr:CHAT domain-containing protein [Thermoanaerobaculia bacterium]
MEDLDDFVLAFGHRGPEGHLFAQVVEPNTGGASDLGRLEEARSLLEEERDDPHEAARRLGSLLFETLIQGAVREAWLTSLERSKTQGRNLRLRLRFDLSDPDQRRLYRLPWECLHRPDTRDFLALDPHSSVLRSVVSPRSPERIELPSRLRLIVTLASPNHLPKLDLARERRRLEALATRLPILDLCFTKKPTLEELTRALDASPIAPVYLFGGHGDFSPEAGGVLCFENRDGSIHPVRASTLADCCKSSQRPWLVLLNACLSADIGTTPNLEAHTSTAAALAMAGIPGVIGMRSPVGDHTATCFSSEFFAALGKGLSVDGALKTARRLLYSAAPDDSEWCTPILTTPAGISILRLQPEPDGLDRDEPSRTAETPAPAPPAAGPATMITGFSFSDNQTAIGVLQGSIDQRVFHYHGDQAPREAESRARLAERYRLLLDSIPEPARPEVAVGLDLLQGGSYPAAAERFHEARRAFGNIPRLAYFEALATIAGRPLAELSGTEAASLQLALAEARHRDPGFAPLALLLAALKLEYFRAGKMVVQPPAPEALLEEFDAAPSRREHLEFLSACLRLSRRELTTRLEGADAH